MLKHENTPFSDLEISKLLGRPQHSPAK
jgi:hypothetical protein